MPVPHSGAIRVKSLLLSALVSVTLLASCGSSNDGGPNVGGSNDGGQDDPKKAYAELVRAAHAGDGAGMYDALDQASRDQFGEAVAMMQANQGVMPGEQQAMWDSVKGLKGKDAFVKMVELNPEMMTSPLKGDYEVLKVDTVVVLSIKHESRPAELTYMRWENGGWRVTSPPAPPRDQSSQLPQGHPDVNTPQQPSQPQGGGDTTR
jgi:hypothetical protein